MLGQREGAALLSIVVMVVALLLGKPNADVAVILQSAFAPLLTALVSFKFLADSINARVADGSLTAGSFKELFALREFWVYVFVLILGAAQMLGVVKLDDVQRTELANSASSFVAIFLTLFQNSLIQRPSSVGLVGQAVLAQSGKRHVEPVEPVGYDR